MTEFLDRLTIPGGAIRDADRLAHAINVGDEGLVRDVLAAASPARLRALVLALALRTSFDRFRELPSAVEVVALDGRLEVRSSHGTHAAFNRHRYAGERPCETCWEGERAYQRTARRRSRVKGRLAAVEGR